jgi:hypothetical protein
MGTTYDRLVAAGAPALTEPRFYRITSPEDGVLSVQLRERLPRLGSRVLGRRRVSAAALNAEDVLPAVVGALREIVAAQIPDDTIGDLLGDYTAGVRL